MCSTANPPSRPSFHDLHRATSQNGQMNISWEAFGIAFAFVPRIEPQTSLVLPENFMQGEREQKAPLQ
jgi:hypothetical protein